MSIIIYSMDELQRLIREGGLPINAPIISGSETLSDAANTLTLNNVGHPLLITPSTTRVQTLPTTGIVAGDIVSFVNLAAVQKITVEASGGVDIATFQNGQLDLMALIDSPTTAAHWRMIKNIGGASPVSMARLGFKQFNITSTARIDLNVDVEDNNSNFDKLTNHRFDVEVPGLYLINGQIIWDNSTLVANDALNFHIYVSGVNTVRAADIAHSNVAGFKTQQISLIDRFTIGQYIDIRASNVARNTSDIFPNNDTSMQTIWLAP